MRKMTIANMTTKNTELTAAAIIIDSGKNLGPVSPIVVSSVTPCVVQIYNLSHNNLSVSDSLCGQNIQFIT